MTPEAKRITIAKAVPRHSGWYDLVCEPENPCYDDCCEAHASMVRNLPDYLNDVRAAHAAVLAIGVSHPGWDNGHFPEKFVRELQAVVGGVPGCLAQHIATAEQVCDALLRTLNLFET